MGMRFADALKLSAKNISEHKGRSLATVVTISILFGVLMAGNFLLNGLERTLLEAENSQAGGEVYAIADIRYLNQSSSAPIESVNSVEDLPDSIETRSSESKMRLIRERLAETGGEVVGETWSYQTTQPYVFVPLEAATGLVTTDLAEVPEGKMPVLTPSGELDLSKDLGDTVYLEEVLYSVGSLPTVKCEEVAEKCAPMLSGDNPLNYFLEKVGVWRSGAFIIIDDGTGRAEEFMQETLEWQVENLGSVRIERPERKLVLKFKDVAQAERYADSGAF